MRYLLLVIILVFVGCGAGSSDEAPEESSNDTVGAEIAADFNKTMQKAEDVEQQLQESKENIDEALEAAEGSVD